ncbi:unnamed protein product [Dovyalis caffra]|uniref:Major facilitator superfamily (MFS) profile domain-containing protein n=1 Tax=Dovyalis caffra TaxID=77055 RepID=A0AAV1R0Y8_9ROSI|nr:unnamed protein product [Dovyalis caffra]
MATSASLLSKSQLSSDIETSDNQEQDSLDDTIEKYIEGFGPAQYLQVILVSLAFLFDGQQTFISDFSDAVPSWHCTDFSNQTCYSSSNFCNLSKSEWAWDEPESSSIVSDWALECGSSVIVGLPASSYFVGSLIGGFSLATLADSWLGRKKLLFLTCLGMSTMALITAFTTNVWMYSGLRFASGIFRASIGTCVVVLSTEMAGKKWGGFVRVVGFLFFAIGALSLPPIAYLNRGSSWRYLYFYTSIPAIFYCIIAYFFVSESPRWLYMQGREDEAVAILNKMVPNKKISSSILKSAYKPLDPEKWNFNIYSSMKSLFERRWALKRMLVVMTLGFGVGTAYYGMFLGVGSLGFNIYLSVTLTASLTILSNLLIPFVLETFNRRSSVVALGIVSGTCCIVCAIIGDELKAIQIVMSLASAFSSCAALNVMQIYTTELFPTCVRISATSMFRQAVNFGPIFVPLLVSAARRNNSVVYGVFGSVVISCIFFVIFLPETKGLSLSNAMYEQEKKDSINAYVS